MNVQRVRYTMSYQGETTNLGVILNKALPFSVWGQNIQCTGHCPLDYLVFEIGGLNGIS